jgi:hypothetical protein
MSSVQSRAVKSSPRPSSACQRLQINYGTGKDVSAEPMRDGGQPLEIKWYSTSFLDLPVSR